MKVSWFVDRFRRHNVHWPGGSAGDSAHQSARGQTAGAVGPAAYTTWRETTLGAITDTLEQRLIVEFVGEVAGKRLLDAGCGDGLLVSALTRRGAYASVSTQIPACWSPRNHGRHTPGAVAPL